MAPRLFPARVDPTASPPAVPPGYWARPVDDLLRELATSDAGLSADAAQQRLARHGPNKLPDRGEIGPLEVFWRQVRSPLLALLVFAALVAAATGAWLDAGIVLLIVAASAGLGSVREYRAEVAAAELRRRVQAHASVLRDGQPARIPLEDIVVGDVVLLAAGSLVPADAVLLTATDLMVDEAPLTGESFPATKRVGPVAAEAALARRANCVYLGTHVRSGAGRCVIVATGAATEFGDIAERLEQQAPETEFDAALRRFGVMLLQLMAVMLTVVLVVNLLLGRPLIETLLFSIALAVGLSPELLPAILSVNLARGARGMADGGVLVRRLNAIENLGSMDVLCTDKTGTLTEGVVRMAAACDARGNPSTRVLQLAATNAALQSGLPNPLDDAILAEHRDAVLPGERIGEVPYDFVRRRLSVALRTEQGALLICKGAVAAVLSACDRDAEGMALDAAQRARLAAREHEWTAAGTRVLGVATGTLSGGMAPDIACERGLRFEGFLTFLDQPKPGIAEAIAALSRAGVQLKLVTGDSHDVAAHVAREVGFEQVTTLTAADLDALPDAALRDAVERTTVFAEVNPQQKERIVRALRERGHVVGFLGDGINDTPAMHAADASLSVDSAVDIAREAADFVLLERNLDVIRRGIEEGRRTLANTLKYVLTTMSANLGNMVSMAIASLMLPFLPLLAGQVLLNNFLSDIPALGLADDRVDPEWLERPRRWDLAFVRRFMIEFGLLSSLFDFATFGLLLWAFSAGPELFRTGWFVESLLTELAVALVVRTARPCWRSRPGAVLLWSTVGVALVAVVVPWLPGAAQLGFVPLQPSLLATILAVVAAYVLATEWLKTRFYAVERSATA